MNDITYDSFVHRIERLNSIGIALSAERDPVRLLEQILVGAKEITHADGGTIYSLGEDNLLRFEIMRTDSLHIALGGTSGAPIPFPPVALVRKDGSSNLGSVVARSVIEGRTINIKDAYDEKGFDFSGTRAFDARTGYRSKSFLAVPLKNHENEIIGVLQLLNALDPSGKVVNFSDADQRLAESLASQAATALTKHHLIEGMRKLLESFIRLIATAIDEKSPYTGNHCRRVPELTLMLADAAAGTQTGPLKAFTLNEAGRYELSLAAWLHDCGKITTPEWVMDKATKLHALTDRIELIDTRYEVLKRDAEIAQLRGIVAGGERTALEKIYAAELIRIEDERAFLHRANTGAEFMHAEDQARVKHIATRTWRGPDGQIHPFLSEDEVKNLTISKGTLTREERQIINNHIVATIKMLESLPYPRQLKRIPEFAGGHHERMDGKGYPKGLKREQMSVQARIMGIADVFEALTAGDRPYKKAMTLSQALTILGTMKLEGHIDPDLYDIFIHSGIWQIYAEKFLKPEQLDAVEVTSLPGYVPPLTV